MESHGFTTVFNTKDIKAGRVYTEEQIREEIFKDCDQD